MSKSSETIWILRHPFKAIFVGLGLSALSSSAFLLWCGYLLFGSDPCRGWRSGMTKNEKIMMTLDGANKSNSLSFEFISPQDGRVYRGLAKQVPYESAEAIIREQPYCCYVYGQESALTDDPKLLDESLRGDEGVVVLRYIGKYKDRHTGVTHTAPTFTYLNLNACKSKKRKF